MTVATRLRVMGEKNAHLLWPWAAAFLSGTALAFGVSMPHMGGVFVAGLFLFIYMSLDARLSPKGVFLFGALAGLVFMGVAFSWIVELHPLSWSGINAPWISLSLVTCMWAIVSIAQAACYGGVAFLLRRISSKPAVLVILASASIWVLMEKVRAFVTALLFYAPVTQLAPHYDLHNAGYVVSQLNLFAQLLPLGGVSLASWAAVLCAATLAALVRKERTAAFLVLIGLLIFSQHIVPLPNARLTGVSVSVGVVTADIEPDFSSEGIKKRVGNFTALLKSSPVVVDMLLLPENSYFIEEKILSAKEPISLAVRTGMIIDSAPRNGAHNLYFYTPDGRVEAYQKIFLMPQGEYLMSFELFFAKLFGAEKFLSNNAVRVHAVAGSTVRPVVLKESVIIGGLLCSEIVSPYLYRDLVKKNATVLTNVASQAVFHNSRTLAYQTEVAAQTRAAELDRYLVLAGNGTDSLVISNQGEIVERIEPQENLRLDVVSVQSNEHKTFFARHGEWIIYISAAYLFFAAGALFVQQRKRRST